MAIFTKKTWKDRRAEFINRRTLTKEDGTEEIVTVARNEGEISVEGDAFNAETMNNLEERIAAGLDTVDKSIAETNQHLANEIRDTQNNINENYKITQGSIEDLRTYTDKSIAHTNENVNDLDSRTQKLIKGLNDDVANRALTTHVHPVESVSATINTSNFKDTSDSWLSVRKVGRIAICTFSLTTARQLSADADYNICKLDAAALYSVRAAASCSGNINGDISIQSNALNYIKISAKSALAAGKTVKGEIVFFV